MTLDREESRSHLRQDDLLRLGWQGLRTHPVRATLSALGIAIGIAAMIAVIGLLLFLNLPIRFPSCVGWAYETAPAGMSGEG